MRVAFTMWPTAAHLNPIVPLAWALRSAGHEVVLVSHPIIGEAATATGLPFAPICDDTAPVPIGPGRVDLEARAEVDRITAAMNIPPQDLGRWNTFAQFYLPSMWDFTPYRGSPEEPLPAMDGMVEFFRRWRPDLVIWDPCMPGSAIAARAAGARHARHSGPDVTGWCLETFEKLTSGPDAPRVPHPMVETLRAMGERYDVPIDRETLYGEWTINPMPPSIALPVDTRVIPVRWIPSPRQEAMAEWLYPLPDRPRIALSLGASMRAYLDANWDWVPLLLEAVGELDVEVIATLNEAQLADVRHVPANVRIIDYVPLDQLVPTCSVLIHHGGLGTMTAAACAKVPQIVVDFFDLDIVAEISENGVATTRYALAPDIGGYVARHGAGEIVDLSRARVEEVRKRINSVLTEPSYRIGAERLYEDMVATPSPHGIVPLLEKLAG